MGDQRVRWSTLPLSGVCDINPPKPKLADVPDDCAVMFVPMAAVDEVTGAVARPETRTLGELRKKSYRTFAPGDVLFAKITPCMENGKAAVVPKIPSGIGFGSTEFHVLRPKEGTNPRFVWYYLRQERFRQEAESHMTGSVGQLRVPVSYLEECPIEIPDTDLQDALVELLDDATGYESSANAHLWSSSQSLTRLRQSVLMAACSGALTADWRASHDDIEPAEFALERKRLRDRERLGTKYREPNSLDADELPELPSTWTWGVVAEVGEVQLGGTPARGQSTFWNGGIPWVSSGEVANCRISTTRETISELGLRKSNAKLYPTGTVLIAMIGEGKTRGQSAILDVEACTNQNVAGVLPDSEVVDPEYVWRWALAQYEVTRAVGRGGNQPALNGQKVKELAIPIPPIPEQIEIVARTEKLLSLAETTAEQVQSVCNTIERSSQSLFAKAFAGELL